MNSNDSQLEDLDPWHTPLLVVFIAACAVNWFYALSRWANLIHSIRSTNFFTDKPANKGGKIRLGEEPDVTIQICTYNEGPVVRETIVRACHVDWPKNKLHVQVLDDSTDMGSCKIVDDAVASLRAEGYDVRRMIREQRVGYKAGSLRFHFPSVATEFVAHFDADHHMEPDFLRRAMPHFFEKDGEEKHDIGVVQAPWGYYNMHQNLLTEADALGLDVHHVVEQCGRSAAYQVFGFNGTGGIWRKSAVRDAGGWTWETVTEDLALSYNAYIKGYKFAYVRDIPQRLEVPGNFQAHVQQKYRWTKGFLQVFRFSYWDILTSRKIPAVVKWESFCHITGPMQYPATILCVILQPFLMLHGIDSPFTTIIALFPGVEPLLSAIITCYAKVPGRGHGEHHTFWDRTCRLHLIAPYFGVKLGMSLFETKAILGGLFSNDATFLTTPKEGLAKSSTSANSVKRQSDDDFLAATATLIGFGRIFTLFHFKSYFHSLHGILTLVMNITVGFSLVWVNMSFMIEKYGGKHSRRMSRIISLVLLVFLMNFLWTSISTLDV